MYWEAYQQTKIASAEQKAGRASAKAESVDEELRRLQRHLDRLSLACQGMWELLRDHSDLTEEDLEIKILEIDNRDGRIDGKMSTQQMTCESCGRPTNSARTDCLMCGAPLKRAHQFET